VAQNQAFSVDVPIEAIDNGGYLMISRIEIHNFRCFDNLSLTGFKRFNVIVGESGSGKSALLESIFLLSGGSPELFFRLRKWRGFGEGPLELNGTKDSFEGLFQYLFHIGSGNPVASVRCVDSVFGKRNLDIYFEDKDTFSLPLNRPPDNSMRITPINFKWDVNNTVTNVSVEIKDGLLRALGSAGSFPLHFVSPRNTSSKFDSQLFSQLSRRLLSDELQSEIRRLFPYIRNLSLEVLGGEALIHAEVEGFNAKIPVNELSGGFNRFLSIALAIAANRDGVILVDEIESGFYFTYLEQVLRSIVRLCDHYSVQMFASTHSLELLQAMANVLNDRREDLALLRAIRNRTECKIKMIPGASSISAILQDVEVRA
jgi:ABC-type oligopeptide transport system ATPase subunit